MSWKGRVIVDALALNVNLLRKHMACIKILCLLGWLDISDRDSGNKSALPVHHHHTPTPWTQFPLTVHKRDMRVAYSVDYFNLLFSNIAKLNQVTENSLILNSVYYDDLVGKVNVFLS